jgi:hypothetical protein
MKVANSNKNPAHTISPGHRLKNRKRTKQGKLQFALLTFGRIGIEVLDRIAAELSCENPFDENGNPTEEAIELALNIAEQACRDYLDQDHAEWLSCEALVHAENSSMEGGERWSKLKQELERSSTMSAPANTASLQP